MTLALATSLNGLGGFDPSDVVTRFTDRYQYGAYPHTGAWVDLGNTTRTALDRFMCDPSNPWQGITTESSAGSGGIMRVVPVFIRYATGPAQGIAHAIDQSRITHAHPECDSAVRRLAKYVYAFLMVAALQIWLHLKMSSKATSFPPVMSFTRSRQPSRRSATPTRFLPRSFKPSISIMPQTQWVPFSACLPERGTAQK